MQILEVVGLELQCLTSGEFFPWLGPALRGMVGLPFKESVCRQPVAEQRERWKECRGCEFMADCPYGQTFDPDPPADVSARSGQDHAARPVVLAPAFPAPSQVQEGDTLPVTGLFLGPAVPFAARVFQAVDSAGRQYGLGRPPRRVRLGVVRTDEFEERHLQLSAADLPAAPADDEPTVDHIRLELTSPLALTVAGQLARRPALVDFVAASLRTIQHLFSLYDAPLGVHDDALKQCAAAVTENARFMPFRQPILSGKGEQRHYFDAITGTIEFRDVPRCLLPWLEWGGRLHVGNRRVAGAGGWRVVATPCNTVPASCIVSCHDPLPENGSSPMTETTASETATPETAAPALPPSKFQLVKSFFAANPQASIDDAVAALKQSGLDISPRYVAQIRSKSKPRPPRALKAPAPKPTAPKPAAPKNAAQKPVARPAPAPVPRAPAAADLSSVSAAAVLQALQFMQSLGGPENARAALAAAEQVQAVLKPSV